MTLTVECPSRSLNNPWVDALTQQQRGGRVPEVVEAHVGQASPFQQWPERPPQEIFLEHRLARPVGEDQTTCFVVSLRRSVRKFLRRIYLTNSYAHGISPFR